MSKTSISCISAAKKQLAAARSLSDILEIRDKAEAIRNYIKAAGDGLEAQNAAAEIKLRAERKAGELLAAMEKNPGGRPTENRSHDVTSLDDLGISKMQSSRWQKEASVSEEEFEGWIYECTASSKEITQAGLLRQAGSAHVSESGENEWYTPAKYIELARDVMQGIDLDPASSEIAQETVKAGAYYSIDNDGLERPWFGNIWLNPPYSRDLVGLFVAKLKESWNEDSFAQAIVLINNATETSWFQELLEIASAACFPRGRIRFESYKRDATNSPLQGQVFIYVGNSTSRFCQKFQEVGACLVTNTARILK